MRTFFLIVLPVLCCAIMLSPVSLYAQLPPADFKFSASTGGVAPLSETAKISLDSDMPPVIVPMSELDLTLQPLAS